MFHAFVLLGYALFGRGFAHIPLGPLYIGEVSLLAGTLWAFIYFSRWESLFGISVTQFIIVFQFGGSRERYRLSTYTAQIAFEMQLFGIIPPLH